MVQQPSLPCYRRVTCGCRRWYTAVCPWKKSLHDNCKPPVAKNSSRIHQRFTTVMLTDTLNRLDSSVTQSVNSCFLSFFFPVYSLIHRPVPIHRFRKKPEVAWKRGLRALGGFWRKKQMRTRRNFWALIRSRNQNGDIKPRSLQAK